MKIRGFVLFFFLFTFFFLITFSNEEEITEEVQHNTEIELETSLEGQLGETQNISLQVKYAFQNATDLVERNIDFGDSPLIFHCSSNNCRVNFDFEGTFTGDLDKNDFVCNINFGFGVTGEEAKCNPNQITFPLGTHNVYIKITNKTNINYFGELNFIIINEEDSQTNSEGQGSEGQNSNSLLGSSLGNQSIVIKYTFQSPTYLVEKDEDFTDRDLVFNCDRSKDDCRINFNFEDTFTGSLKKNDFACKIDFGLGGITGEEEKCNPNTVIFPIGKTEVKVKITNKSDESYFGELIFTIINDGKLSSTNGNTYITYSSSSSSSSTKSQLNLSTPIIKVQSGLDSNNKCNKSECSINFTYEPTEYKTTEIICRWDFGEGIMPDGADEKCNPTYVKYGPGKHKVTLEVCDENYDYNCKSTSFEFENVYGVMSEDEKQKISEDKDGELEESLIESGGEIELEAKITLQGKIAKTKIVEGNKITCEGVDSCSINFTGTESIGKNLTYFWDFGNGEISEKSNPNSVIFIEGEYTTILEVTNEKGDVSEAIFDIVVTGKSAKLLESGEDLDDKLVLSGLESGGEVEEEKAEFIDLKIELQGKIGQNKILKGNELTCVKTCSVNFDGSKSEGKLTSYFWDFGNGETSSKVNPGYVSYKDFGDYIVLLSAEDKAGNVYEEEFYVNFVEKLEDVEDKTNEKSNLISLDDDFEEEEILVEFGGIDYDENSHLNSSFEEENEKHFGKYIVLVIIILGLGGIFVLLKRYRVA